MHGRGYFPDERYGTTPRRRIDWRLVQILALAGVFLLILWWAK